MAENILDLTTVVDRKTITITSKKHPKGKQYEVTSLDDFGPFEYVQILQKQSDLAPLQEKEATGKKLTAAEKLSVERMLDEMVSMIVLGLEPAVAKELTQQKKEMIFFAWVASISDEGAAEGNAPGRQTTAASSRGSRRSTAATRSGGSTPRRGR